MAGEPYRCGSGGLPFGVGFRAAVAVVRTVSGIYAEMVYSLELVHPVVFFV